jgi:microcystin-dependent protein
MIVTNQTTSDIYFGPLHLGGGVGTTLTVDDTSATSLYLTNDSVADALNNAFNSGKITASGAADPFPRPTGDPQLLHGSGDPDGLVFAPQGSVYMRRDGAQTNGGVLYMKTTGVTFNTGWVDLATASGATALLPPGTIAAFGGSTAPSGWLACDGSAVSRTVYSLLFAVVGTLYGVGDGSTTFNLPDLRGRVGVGYAATGGHTDVSALGNNEGVTTSANRRPKHRHTPHSHSYTQSGGENSMASGSITVLRNRGRSRP